MTELKNPIKSFNICKNKQTNKIQHLLSQVKDYMLIAQEESPLEQSKHRSVYTTRKKQTYLFWAITVSSLRQPYQITVQLVTVSIKFTLLTF